MTRCEFTGHRFERNLDCAITGELLVTNSGSQLVIGQGTIHNYAAPYNIGLFGFYVMLSGRFEMFLWQAYNSGIHKVNLDKIAENQEINPYLNKSILDFLSYHLVSSSYHFEKEYLDFTGDWLGFWTAQLPSQQFSQFNEILLGFKTVQQIENEMLLPQRSKPISPFVKPKHLLTPFITRKPNTKIYVQLSGQEILQLPEGIQLQESA
jgi:hypothetical protein